jgi:hypothetical protein
MTAIDKPGEGDWIGCPGQLPHQEKFPEEEAAKDWLIHLKSMVKKDRARSLNRRVDMPTFFTFQTQKMIWHLSSDSYVPRDL